MEALAASFSPRWIINTTTWTPCTQQQEYLLSLLSDAEAKHVSKYVRIEDQRRALASQLLQRHCISTLCAVSHNAVTLKRTKGSKPFSTTPKPTGAPNLNFNVSHEGDYTVLVAEPFCLVGVDVAAPSQLRRPGRAGGIQAAIQLMRNQFSPSEWLWIHAKPDESSLEARFQQLWSCKEAFIKARGDGLGFSPLSRAQFSLLKLTCPKQSNSGGLQMQMELDGVVRNDWRFELHQVEGHWLTVAKGPPSAAVDAHGEFISGMGCRNPTPEVIQAELDRPAQAFTELCIEQILSAEAQIKYLSIQPAALV